MKIKDIIKTKGESLSFEFFPPKNKEAENELFEAIGKLEHFAPTFVSVTYGAGGSTLKNTIHVVERIKQETSLMPMPHLTCMNQSKEELTRILQSYQSLGIKNVLALRGDPPKEMAAPLPRDGLCYARDLVQLVASFDSFSIGVAVYPEGHIEAISPEMDLLYTKQKIDAGADFAITQMFFDNRYFYDFMERAERIGINIPIIPGIMPITDTAKIKKFCQSCGAILPIDLVHRLEKAASPDEVRKIGLEFATKQCEDLRSNGIRYLHFYTLNRADAVAEILRNLKPNHELEPARASSN
ncbi:MAG: methylenetetrahydrofolate reductase [NAD(P)H] [Nitrososphaerota archaeon]|nr:methylenetetrahydrofolate reductase [NAD(P)H] [Nitrososphaerota archaeon]